jgi:hypothetical protein
MQKVKSKSKLLLENMTLFFMQYNMKKYLKE